MKGGTGAAEIIAPALTTTVCPHCKTPFTPRRSNQQFCGRACQKASSRHTARGARTIENATRNRDHYSRAAWLCYDILRMPEARREGALHDLLVAARGGRGAKLRNILQDPRLLGAPRESPLGKLYPDTSDPSVRNIAQQVNAYCQRRWGKGSREILKADCLPRDGRAEAPETSEAETYWQAMRREGKLERQSPAHDPLVKSYDWRRLARAMRDRGWRRYFTPEELDEMLEIRPPHLERGSFAVSFGAAPDGDIDLLDDGSTDGEQVKLAA
ncbi:hypothetical protein SAMN06265378_10991 [Paracoccus sediminis]|uniref:Uncharacterized protein n=1 Tax=Paracoccus sediminis TaxID=1214787 RepID=A0A238XDS4_9RHOB|nr:hypothetical protein SAMN06265378_10991 [Paracoccus sediminis]